MRLNLIHEIRKAGHQVEMNDTGYLFVAVDHQDAVSGLLEQSASFGSVKYGVIHKAIGDGVVIDFKDNLLTRDRLTGQMEEVVTYKRMTLAEIRNGEWASLQSVIRPDALLVKVRDMTDTSIAEACRIAEMSGSALVFIGIEDDRQTHWSRIEQNRSRRFRIEKTLGPTVAIARFSSWLEMADMMKRYGAICGDDFNTCSLQFGRVVVHAPMLIWTPCGTGKIINFAFDLSSYKAALDDFDQRIPDIMLVYVGDLENEELREAVLHWIERDVRILIATNPDDDGLFDGNTLFNDCEMATIAGRQAARTPSFSRSL